MTLDRHTVTFFGTVTDEVQTTFARPVTIAMRDGVVTEFYDIAFVGDGGTGLTATEGVWLTNCRFQGWEIGADAQEGSWINMAACDFMENGIGFRFNSTTSSCSCETYENMVFSGNETGVQVLNIPHNGPISFVNCLFEDNITDIEDPKGLVKQ